MSARTAPASPARIGGARQRAGALTRAAVRSATAARSLPAALRRAGPARWLAVPVGLVVAGVAVPLVYLVLRAAEADPAALAALVWRPRTLRLALNTVGLAAAVVALATLVATPLAWLAARAETARFPRAFRRFVTAAGVLPLALPGYVMATALLGATGPRGLLAGWPGVVLPRPAGFWGALAVLTLATFPYLFLNLRSALAGLDPVSEDAARSLGLGPWAVARRVVVPQLRPAWLAGALLVALHVVGDFGVVSLVRFETFSGAIYVQYTASYDRVYAAALALMLLAVAAAILAAEARLLGAARFARGDAARRPERVRLGWGTLPALAFAATVAIAAVGIPLATLVFWLGRAPVDVPRVLVALANSVSAAAPAALVATLLAVPIAVVGVRRPGGIGPRTARTVERVAYLGYATPPLALALAVVAFAVRAAPFAYQTLGLLVAAYVVHFLAEAVGPVRSALLQAPPAAEWAARSLGRSPWGAFRDATLPQVRGGLATSAAFVFLSVLKELPITLLLAPLGFTSLATGVWSAAGEALYATAAPYALVIVAVAGALVALLLARDR